MSAALRLDMRTIVLIGCLLAALACEPTSPTMPLPVNRELVLAPGEAVSISEASVSVRFMGVVADSRCPAAALCVSVGEGIVRVVIEPAVASPAVYDLHTGAPAATRHADLALELVRLSPYPLTVGSISPEEYRATLRVTRVK